MAFLTSDIQQLPQALHEAVQELHFGTTPEKLYKPLDYIMSSGGKRMRPTLVILAYYLYHDSWQHILQLALVPEVFHNFSLIHDDIMDNAPLRRGKPTVHEKWDTNVAILSGDVMLVKAYEQLLCADEKHFKRLVTKFSDCATKVCEGQQMDMNFETQTDVSIDDYLQMIRYKTAVLLGFSLEMGAILADANVQDTNNLYQIGVHAGIGFQLQDDYLDVYANQETFGKQVGGDILENKKTFLLLKAKELASKTQNIELNQWLKQTDQAVAKEKIDAVRAIYDSLGIPQLVEQEINTYFQKSYQSIDRLKTSDDKKELLIMYLEKLRKRDK